MNGSTAAVAEQLRGLSRTLLGSPMDNNGYETMTTTQTPLIGFNLSEDKSYRLTDRQLWRIITSLVKNISTNSQKDAISQDLAMLSTTLSPNITESTGAYEGLDSPDSMIIFVLVFFLWYGGLIFVCLIGLGVYKKPSSYEIYKKFVDRQDLREQLKREKDEERQQRKLLRQHSGTSVMSSFSLPDSFGNGQIVNSQRLTRSYPSSKAMESLVHVEEEESLLERNETDPYQDKVNGLNNRAIFQA